MTMKELIQPIPGVRYISLWRQRLSFNGSAEFWEHRYAKGGSSGSGSYGDLAHGKASFLNAFVCERGIRSVIEFGCGDGHQLSLAKYPKYTGFDVSRSAIDLCKRRFGSDSTKSFFLYDGSCFVDSAQVFRAEVAISLDVIYHLIEDDIYETYLGHLFQAATRYVIIYSTNNTAHEGAPHVRHRCFTSWVEKNRTQWRLAQVSQGPDRGLRRADFFVFELIIS